MIKIFKLVIFCLVSSFSFAQGQSSSLRVLFLGNSYTYVNNLPQILADIATSMGDTLIFDSNLIGGYTLQQHSADATSLNKIMQGNLEYVVLQEQSQLPSFPISQVETDVFPYAHILDSIINLYNPCVETMFYMTWGRKNGDASNCPTWPPVCTYNGMDSLLHLRYMMMADSNDAVVSPAGAVWKYIRQNFPLIDLYQADESHPSAAGSYAAACSFYTALFRKDPTLITYNYTLNASDAANIRTAAKLIVFDSLITWHIGEYDPATNFSYTVSAGNQVSFNNLSTNAANYKWYFGDGDSSNSISPIHVYAVANIYNVVLVAARCNRSDTIQLSVNSALSGLNNIKNISEQFSFNPNPVTDLLTIHSDLFLSDVFKINIKNAVGQLVFSSANSFANKQVIDFSRFAGGVYLISVLKDKKVVCSYKIVK